MGERHFRVSTFGMNFCEGGIIVCSAGVYWCASRWFAKVESHRKCSWPSGYKKWKHGKRTPLGTLLWRMHRASPKSTQLAYITLKCSISFQWRTLFMTPFLAWYCVFFNWLSVLFITHHTSLFPEHCNSWKVGPSWIFFPPLPQFSFSLSLSFEGGFYVTLLLSP